MAGFELRAGAKIDLLTKDELDGSLGHYWDEALAERARGIKPLQFGAAPQAQVSATAGFTIAQAPKEGYVWSLRLLAVSFPSPGNVAEFYRGSDTSTGIPSPNTLTPLASGSSGLVSSASFGKGQLFLRSSDFVVIAAASAVTLNSYLMSVVEVPAELIWKVC